MLSNVVGIDIHPLAVTIARATYVLALRDLVKATKRPIQIPVYLADALFLPREVRQLTFEDEPGYEIRFGKNKSVSIPEELIQSPEMFDPAIAACAGIAIDHASTGKETEGSLRKYLDRAVPQVPAHKEGDAMVRALWRFTRELADLIAKQENSIWAFIVKNAYRPAMLRDQFDFIVGNPPWLSYRYIADPEYQAEVKKRAVTDYGIAPESKKLTTQMELATVFLVHALATFGKVGALLGFVMPRSVLSADQHENLRLRNYRAPVEVTDYWDLLDVAPIFNVPSCVLFAERTKEPPRAKSSYTVPAWEWSGTLTSRDETWAVAEGEVAIAEGTARVIYLGDRSALSTRKGKTKPTTPSQYAGRFRQGATIVPRNCYFVEVEGLNGRPDPERIYSARTEPEQAQLAKAPYKGVELAGQLEGRFLFCTVLSKHILPFLVLDPAVVALPIGVRSGRALMWDSDHLRKEGYRHFAKWMSEVERMWADKRGSKADRQTVYERLDYNRELSEQDLDAPHLVLYNAAGTNLCAAAFDRTASELTLVVDAKVYWAACNSAEEADYLAAILNSATANEAIKPFQSMGLLGERDIHKKVLDLPIPVYDKKNADHRGIATLGAKARSASAAYAASSSLPPSLGRARGVVREAIAATFPWVDQIAELTNTKLREQLDDRLVESLQAGGSDNLWLAVPDLLEWNNVAGFRYTESKRQPLLDDIHVTTFLGAVRDPSKVSMGTLRQKKVYCFSTAGDLIIGKWPVYQCLYFETDLDGETFLLSGGKWYRVERDFVTNLDKFVRDLPRVDDDLPPYDDDNEAAYNARAADENGDYALMDDNLVARGGGQTPIEFCDLFSTDGRLVHVKRYGGSSVLSHLFAQGLTSIELFLTDSVFRSKLNEKLPSTHRLDDPDPAPEPSDYEIVFGIISKSTKALRLPLFSKINLRHAAKRIGLFRVRLAIARIENRRARS